MGMGFTPKLALADDRPAPRSLTAEEYEDCLALIEDATASPSPSASASETQSTQPSPSASEGADSPAPSATSGTSDGDASGDGAADNGSSSDSGSDDDAEPAPAPSATGDQEPQDAAPAPSEPESGSDGGGVLDAIGDTVTGVVDGITGLGEDTETATPTPTQTPSPSASTGAGEDTSAGDDTSGDTSGSGDSGKDTAGSGKVTDQAGDAADEVTDAVSDAAGETEGAADEATASPTPSASSTTDPDDCPIATDAEGGIDNKLLLPDNPWYLNASSLTLKGADYQGVVKVKTASGKVKEVLKYVVSDGTDIGDLHQMVKDEQSGKTYHVQADKGSTSTITDGDTLMYTEKISGNLFGLIPITFSPENPPPLNIPLIYFTNVKVQQAGQFGGTLHVPGLSSYITN
ncbi:hypothetical protein GCM10010254_65730 [Streptomyces chromofuscus]|nr:hypothetical protein GCM10010254_65730 [Streptomyces chromofuscus]